MDINFQIERTPWDPVGVEYTPSRGIVAEVRTEDESLKRFRRARKGHILKTENYNFISFSNFNSRSNKPIVFSNIFKIWKECYFTLEFYPVKIPVKWVGWINTFLYMWVHKKTKHNKTQYLRKLPEAVVLHQPCGINQERTDWEMQEITRDLTQEAGKEAQDHNKTPTGPWSKRCVVPERTLTDHTWAEPVWFCISFNPHLR